MEIAELRGVLRRVARAIDREVLPAYDAARWSDAARPESVRPEGVDREITRRLAALSPELAASYAQVHADLADDARQTFLGPAGEVREVLRAAIHLMAPDEEIRSQSWFTGHEGRPTQAERIRFILESRSPEEAPIEAAEVVETKVARLGRHLYSRASRALHVGTQREELRRIVAYVEAVLNEILPA